MNNTNIKDSDELSQHKLHQIQIIENEACANLGRIGLAQEYLNAQRRYLGQRAIELREEQKTLEEVNRLKSLIKAHELGITEMNLQLNSLRKKCEELEFQVEKQSNLITILMRPLEKEAYEIYPITDNMTVEISNLLEETVGFSDILDYLMECITSTVFDGYLSPEHSNRLRTFLRECASSLMTLHSAQMKCSKNSPLTYVDSHWDHIFGYLNDKIDERIGSDGDFSLDLPADCTMAEKVQLYLEGILKLEDRRRDNLQNSIEIFEESIQKYEEDLEKAQTQLTTLKNEREQLITSLHRKHGESVSFYERMKSMEALMKQEKERFDEKSEKCRSLEEKMEQIVIKINRIVGNIESLPDNPRLKLLSDLFISVLDPSGDLSCFDNIWESITSSLNHDRAMATDLAKAKGELERLKAHMLSNEDNYTSEMVSARNIEKSMRQRLAEVEDELLRTTEALNEANSMAFKERERLRVEIQSLSEEQIEINHKKEEWQVRALSSERNLQNMEIVVNDLYASNENMEGQLEDRRVELERISKMERELSVENSVVKNNLENVRNQLQQSSDHCEQLENKISRLKSKLSLESLAKENVEKTLNSRNDDFIEIAIVKNILLNYFSSPGSQKDDLLRLIGRILRFSDDEKTKVGISYSLHSSLLSPQGDHSTTSLSNEFIHFLEREASISPEKSGGND